MASANKSTGLQIALVFTVMATIIAVVVAFLQYKTANETKTLLEAANANATKAEGDYRAASADVQTLKDFLGYGSTTDIGKSGAEGENSVIGQAKKLIADVAPGELTQPTVAATLQKLGAEMDSLRKDLEALRAERMRLNDRILALKGEYQKMVDAFEKQTKDAEKDRTEAQTSKEEAVKEKEKEVAERQAKIQELQASNQAISQEYAQTVEKMKVRSTKLEQINSSLRQEKETREKTSFEIANGRVEWADQDTKLVWINRGSDDALRPGTTFSVYTQTNKGVARGTQDIKGAIEVTKVIGPHMSEARVTRQSISNPIVAGDPFYTPLWKPGRKEKFALVGLIDIDGDGISDRDVLHDLVTAAGGEIVDEVNDQGVRKPASGAINVDTKFLVLGRIPDFTESGFNEKEAHQKIANIFKTMQKEAMENGVRIVSLVDFLNYIGYEPGRRIWRPGVTTKWTLRSGSMGTAERPGPASRMESRGTTSGAFSGKGNPLRESSGVRTPAKQ